MPALTPVTTPAAGGAPGLPGGGSAARVRRLEHSGGARRERCADYSIHLGLRFSKNAASPSFASSPLRTRASVSGSEAR